MNGKGQRYNKFKVEGKDREQNQHSPERLIWRESEGRGRLSQRKLSWVLIEKTSFEKVACHRLCMVKFGNTKQEGKGLQLSWKKKKR